ncbi:MAG: FtsW/RodA/SpoVE family cell cycle protein [Firmicutes bacterium]|nr:FtsW/RodA/SpoVE family cell cycle protein [Bacillota bacterium]
MWLIVIVISIYGLVLVRSASRAGGYFFASQFVSVVIGLCFAFLFQFFCYQELSRMWIWIGIFCATIMVYTLIFGSTVRGLYGVNAKAWIKLPGGISFQPSELAKIGFLFTLAKHLEVLKTNGSLKNLKSLALLATHISIPIVLTHLQGDDGAAIVFLCIAIFEIFIAGLDVKFFLWGTACFTMLIPIIWNFWLAPYQKNRILNQVNPEADPFGMGFQQIQGKLSIGSGGFLGNGLFCGRRVSDGRVPIQESDFIISVAGEELGFIGCLLIIFLMLVLILRIAYVSKHAPDYLGLFSCFGFLGLIASQCIFNIGMCLSLIPVIGVTLPFFSAGGSSIICLYLGVGLIQNIYISRRKF